MNLKISASIVALAMLVVAPLAAMAATPFAGEDFDSGTTNGGFTSTTQVFTPDLSGTTPAGSFDGGFYDRYGIVSQSDNLAYDFVDDSAGSFPPDSIGILDSTKLDNVVILADTKNGNNPDPDGAVSATWTFDISGKSNIELGIDFAMIGDFDISDIYNFSYSIDGGSSTTAFDIKIDTADNGFPELSDSGIFYGVNMESGGFFDRYFTPFFNDGEWSDLVSSGEEPGVLEFHARDDGTDGDTTAQDGFIPITSLGGTIEERAYNIEDGDGDFYRQIEKVAYKDPLFVNPTTAPDASGNNFDSGTQLTDDFQTITVPVVGTGTTLTLVLNAETNSNQEALMFDNILLSEADAAGITGDYDGSGQVEQGDLDLVLLNWGSSTPPIPAGWTNTVDLIGVVDQAELDTVLLNWGNTSATAVPEPTALLLVTLAAGLGFVRRR